MPTFGINKTMRIRTPIDFGAVIRDRRKKLQLDQKSLADKVGVSRQWIVEVEKGKPGAEMGLVLRTVEALGISLKVDEGKRVTAKTISPGVDIDSIVSAARQRRK